MLAFTAHLLATSVVILIDTPPILPISTRPTSPVALRQTSLTSWQRIDCRLGRCVPRLHTNRVLPVYLVSSFLFHSAVRLSVRPRVCSAVRPLVVQLVTLRRWPERRPRLSGLCASLHAPALSIRPPSPAVCHCGPSATAGRLPLPAVCHCRPSATAGRLPPPTACHCRPSAAASRLL